MPVAATFAVADPAVLKKLSPAATAEAATSDVLASVLIAVFSAALRLRRVAVRDVAPIAKLPAGVGMAFDAVSWIGLGGAIGQIEFQADLVAAVRIGGRARSTPSAAIPSAR